MKISLLSNPHSCTNELINNLLKSYFTISRYLRTKDIFSINVKKYYPETKYCTADSKLELLHFQVNSILTENEELCKNGIFLQCGKTTLIQEPDVHSFIPCKCTFDFSIISKNYFHSDWPPALKEPLQQLQSCISPFLHKGKIFFFIKHFL